MKIDLTNCDQEPIHIPGRIQSFGHLVAIEIATQKVAFCSENVNDIFECDALDLLGNPLNVFGKETACYSNYLRIEEHVKLILKDGIRDINSSIIININEKPYHVIFTISGKYLVIEFEEVISFINDKHRLNNSVRKLVNEPELEKLLSEISLEVKKLIGYDRVMIYQFLEDQSGKVVAEAKNEDLESYMDLHYPESDIPKQARALYVINKTRQIADVFSTDSNVISKSDVPLDMTYCKTRAVSPMHIEYLKNMGVVSSFSVSIVVEGELWGLIACHNYTSRRIDLEVRQSAELLGEIISSVITVKSKEKNIFQEAKFQRIHLEFQKKLLLNNHIDKVLMDRQNNLLNATNATGVSMFFEDHYHSLGATPPKEFVQRLLKWFVKNHQQDIFHTNHLSEYFPEAKGFVHCCSGILIVLLSMETLDAIIFFKPEVKSQITWAGKPDKAVEMRKQGGEMVYEIHPRKSFEVYTENISDRSHSWSQEEIKSAEKVKQIILETALLKSKELKDLNAKLQEAYSELDTFAYTVAHDLKTPLTVMKANAQMIKRVSNDENILDKINKIVEGANDMTAMMDEVLGLAKISSTEMHLQKVDMKSLLKKVVENGIVAYETPATEVAFENIQDVFGDPTMLFQLFQNIVGNALKYSAKNEKPQLNISARNSSSWIIYEITDNGIGIAKEDLPKIFELFERFSNAKKYHGSGVGMAIVKRIIDKHNAVIDIKSELNKGTTIILKFPEN